MFSSDVTGFTPDLLPPTHSVAQSRDLLTRLWSLITTMEPYWRCSCEIYWHYSLSDTISCSTPSIYYSTKPIVGSKTCLKRFLGWSKHCDTTFHWTCGTNLITVTSLLKITSTYGGFFSGFWAYTLKFCCCHCPCRQIARATFLVARLRGHVLNL